MLAARLPMPAAYADPAFMACVNEAINTPELLTEFDRLYGAGLSTNKPKSGDMRAFIGFVHQSVYLCLPDDAIHSLRVCGLTARKAKPTTQEVSHG